MRIVPRHELANQRARDLAKIIHIIDNTPTPTTPTAKQIGHRSGEGDRQRMRAIPVIAEAVGGTIPGTNPLDALLNNEARTNRHAPSDPPPTINTKPKARDRAPSHPGT